MSCGLHGSSGGFLGRNQWREAARPFRHRGRRAASGVRSAGGDVPVRLEGRCPFGAGLSCFAPSPGGAGSRPFRASIPIAGAPPASRRLVGCMGARPPRTRPVPHAGARARARFPEVPEAGVTDPSRHASEGALQEERGGLRAAAAHSFALPPRIESPAGRERGRKRTVTQSPIASISGWGNPAEAASSAILIVPRPRSSTMPRR